MAHRDCLSCGMTIDLRVRRCPKCDNELDQQTDGSTVTVDIAHQGERVHEAMRKLHREVNQTKQGIAQYLRLVVGSGVIREEAMNELATLEHRKTIQRFDLDTENSGVILIKLKP